MPIVPPKCKTCGKIEWRHTCSGSAPSTEARLARAREAIKKLPDVLLARPARRRSSKPKTKAKGNPMPNDPATPEKASPAKPGRGRPKTGFDKKAHDREKARERRAAKKAKP